jgi:hypothetical protein
VVSCANPHPSWLILLLLQASFLGQLWE